MRMMTKLKSLIELEINAKDAKCLQNGNWVSNGPDKIQVMNPPAQIDRNYAQQDQSH